MQALLDAAAQTDFPGKVALVVSNRPKAAGLERAKQAGIKTCVIDHTQFGTKENQYDDGRDNFDAALDAALTDAEIDFVFLAGFMRILTSTFVTNWRGRLVNIHPSLLPAFKGLNVHERMIDAGVKLAGCTVHFVSPEMDAGPIIGQASVPVLPSDDADTLAARILKQEHRLYPLCMELLCNGGARLSTGGIVRFDEKFAASGALLNPAIEAKS